jgi:hypothetical protein
MPLAFPVPIRGPLELSADLSWFNQVLDIGHFIHASWYLSLSTGT